MVCSVDYFLMHGISESKEAQLYRMLRSFYVLGYMRSLLCLLAPRSISVILNKRSLRHSMPYLVFWVLWSTSGFPGG